MKRFYVYSNTDEIQYSKQVESFLNNTKIRIVDIQYQVTNSVYPTGHNKINREIYNSEKTIYSVFITYEEV